MNVYVMADIEGISGIYCREQVIETESRYQEGRRYITEEINACVEGLKAAGVERIAVRDCHGGGRNIVWELLSPEADDYLVGKVGDTRYPMLEEYDAVVLLGYHAMAGTQDAILEHTYSSANVQNMEINGVRVGEIAVDAAIAGEYGKPVIMVSGDDKACAEASHFLPDVVTAQVKRGLACQGGVLMPPERAHSLIYHKAIEAVKKADRVQLFRFMSPIKCKIELVERGQLPRSSVRPYMQVLDGRSFLVGADTVEQALWRGLF